MRKRVCNIIIDYRPYLHPYAFGIGHTYIHFYRKFEGQLSTWEGTEFETYYEANPSDMERLKYIIRKKDGNL